MKYFPIFSPSKRQSKSPLKDASQTEYNPQSYADEFKG